MRITPITSSKALQGTGTQLTRVARTAVHAMMSRLTDGSLVVEEEGQAWCFGQPRTEASVSASIHIRDPRAWLAVLRNGSLGAGEAYMEGWWDSPDLVQVIRVFVRNMATLDRMEQSSSWWSKATRRLFHAWRRNTLSGSRQNIAAHYDLSNDFFRLFLDSTMAYSAGLFPTRTETLEAASINKFRHICERLQLTPADHLLEIGTGWGGLAIYAAKHYGCRVTTTTLSLEQYTHACEWVAREGLADRVTVLHQDYRHLEGTYDKLVSVEMIEAVGAEFYADYFSRCCSLLRRDGLMLIQAITISDQRYEASLGNTDFIKRYIFPGGQLPSNAVIAANVAEHTDMQLIGLEDITLDYALTLAAWRERFCARLHEARALGCDETFIRMWRYYLCFCEGGFRERVIHTAQFLLARPGFRATPAVGARR